MRSGHDLVIRGGTVYDGSGGSPLHADVAIDGDRIAAVGPVAERGTREHESDLCLKAPVPIL